MPNANPEIIANPERLAALRRLSLLDSPADPAFDRLTELACRILNAPVSTVTLIDETRQYFKSQVGVGEPWASRRETPLEYSYCQHVVATQRPLIVADSRIHPLLQDNLATLEEGMVAYAGIPLITSDGDTLGSFCVIDKKERVWTDGEIEILTDLAQFAITEIELQAELVRRRDVESELRKSEQRLQAVISSAPVILYTVDQDGVITMNEGKAFEAVGGTSSLYLGQSSFDVYAHSPEVVDGIRRGLAGETVSVLTQQSTKIGPVHYNVRISPLYDVSDSIIGAIGVATDVSEQLNAEQSLERSIKRLTLLRRVDVELSESLDLQSVLTIAMDTALRTTGAKHGMIGLIDGDQLRAVHTSGNHYHTGLAFSFEDGIVGRALRTHQPQLILDVDNDPDYVEEIHGIKAEMVIPLIHRDHLIGVLNLETSQPEQFTRESFDFLNMIASHITVAIDNAQLYQVSQQQLEELHHLYMRVSELEQLKTDMIRIAAHDLRNPLGIIKGYTAILLEEKENLSPDHLVFVEAIDTSGEKMLKIINDILSLQRVETMQNKANCDEIDLTDMVRALASECNERARRKDQTYQVILPETPLPVCVDSGQVREAIDNLIGNAIKYTPDGGSVTVELVRNGERAVFEVRDTGYGVGAEEQARLFQPFFRASNARASNIEGTGLGLHLVRNIIERHGGRMRFHSVLGEGSTFGFELPLQRS